MNPQPDPEGADPAPAAPAPSATDVRHFLTTRGRGLPLPLTGPLTDDQLRHRNTWFSAGFDAQGRMLWVVQRVYGDVTLRHAYTWDGDGLVQARVWSATTEDGQDTAQDEGWHTLDLCSTPMSQQRRGLTRGPEHRR